MNESTVNYFPNIREFERIYSIPPEIIRKLMVTYYNYYYDSLLRCLQLQILHKKSSFPLRISSVNVTKSARNCRFSHIY